MNDRDNASRDAEWIRHFDCEEAARLSDKAGETGKIFPRQAASKPNLADTAGDKRSFLAHYLVVLEVKHLIDEEQNKIEVSHWLGATSHGEYA